MTGRFTVRIIGYHTARHIEQYVSHVVWPCAVEHTAGNPDDAFVTVPEAQTFYSHGSRLGVVAVNLDLDLLVFA